MTINMGTNHFFDNSAIIGNLNSPDADVSMEDFLEGFVSRHGMDIQNSVFHDNACIIRSVNGIPVSGEDKQE